MMKLINNLINIKRSVLALFIFVFSLSLLFLTGCNEQEKVKILRVYNWQEYIDDGTDDGNKVYNSVMEDFEIWYEEKYGEKIIVQYETFETNEVMLNTLKTGKTEYDLVCPSEYAIQKMIKNDMIIKYDFNLKDKNGDLIFSNYGNISDYIINLFKEDSYHLDEYAVPYMWGTMGFIYVNNEDETNIENGFTGFDEEEVKHWDVLWETDLKASAKDSIRDTYVVGVMYYYRDELRQNREVYLEAKEAYDAHFEDYQNGLISENEYKAFYDEFKLKQDIYRKSCGEIMNRCDDETIKHVEEVLVEMKDNIYSFEVDNGKNDIVTGKISLNFAWSGDAVYSMDVAEEEEGVNLYYSVPEEGRNVWFDGWVMPKGANVELAQSFVNYLCSEEIAIRNMDFIGYTSSVVGDEILNRIDENYGVEEGDEGYDVDLTYLFGSHVSDDKKDENGRVIVTVSERGRQFDAQYPDEEVISRCGIMEDFGDQYSKVLALWENVKIGHISPIANIIVIVGIVLMVAFVYGSKLYRNYIRRKRKEKFRVTE